MENYLTQDISQKIEMEVIRKLIIYTDAIKAILVIKKMPPFSIYTWWIYLWTKIITDLMSNIAQKFRIHKKSFGFFIFIFFFHKILYERGISSKISSPQNHTNKLNQKKERKKFLTQTIDIKIEKENCFHSKANIFLCVFLWRHINNAFMLYYIWQKQVVCAGWCESEYENFSIYLLCSFWWWIFVLWTIVCDLFRAVII